LIPENPFVYSSAPVPLDLENTDLFRENTDSIFGLLCEGSGNYVPLNFEEALQNKNSSDVIFVINHTPKSQNQVSSADQVLCPWHVRNILAYFALKGVGVEAPNNTGRVVRLILSSPSANSGLPLPSRLIFVTDFS
jgi:hypothetical protein